MARGTTVGEMYDLGRVPVVGETSDSWNGQGPNGEGNVVW